jgi:aminopeptidase N
VHSLTRAEAATRASLIAVHATTVELDLTTGDSVFRSRATIRFSATAGATTFADVKPAHLLSAQLNGAEVDLGGFDGARLALPGLADQNVLVVEADMRYSRDGEGLHRYTDPADGQTYLYAHTFLDAAPRIFACFDQPDLKSPYTLEVTAPQGWTVLGNAPAAFDGQRWLLAETKPLPTYLITLIAGPYHSVYQEHDGIPLGLHCRASLASYLDTDAAEIFELTGQCFDEYHRLFGLRYPFGKYDQVFCPEFNAGAMENPGCVTFREDFVFRSAVTDNEREDRAKVIAHEMAHMWFGDLVTMRWWDDLWLNESFADYAGYRITAHATRYTEAWTEFSLSAKGFGYVADQRSSTHPVSADVADAHAGLLNFDRISYAKGASVLLQLAVRIGDEAMFAGLRAYFQRHAYGNASLSDLLAALGEASGQDLTGWAKVWLREANVNTLWPEFTVSDGRLSGFSVLQSAPASHPVLREHTLNIGLYPGGLHQVQVAGERTALPQLTGQVAPDFVLVNDSDLTYAKVWFDPGSLRNLSSVLPALSPVNRALVWSALFQGVRDGGMDPAGYVDLLVAAMPAETNVSLLTEIIDGFLPIITGTYLDPAGRETAMAKLASAYHGLLGSTPAGDNRRLTVFRGLIQATADPGTLRAWLGGEGVPAGLTVDVERAWQIRYRLGVLGELSDVELAGAAAADRSAQGEQYTAQCRAAKPSAEAKAAVWESVMGDPELSNYEVLALAKGFWQPEQASLTSSYVARYFAELPGAGKIRGFQSLEQLTAMLYPRYAVEEPTLLLAEQMLARPGLDPAIRRHVMDRTDDLRLALTARTNGQGV